MFFHSKKFLSDAIAKLNCRQCQLTKVVSEKTPADICLVVGTVLVNTNHLTAVVSVHFETADVFESLKKVQQKCTFNGHVWQWCRCCAFWPAVFTTRF